MRLLLLFLLYICKVLADVSVTSPKPGSSYAASGGNLEIEIVWEDDGESPGLDEVTEYQFLLMTGTDLDILPVETSGSIKPSAVTGYKYAATFSADSAPDGTYFIQIFAAYSSGYTMHYSGRFKLTGMDGTLSVSVASVTETNGPAEQISLRSASIDSRSFTIPYTAQTGVSRFAPMQQQPGSTVTLATWTRKYASSAVTYYPSLINSLQQKTTITPGWSYTRNSDYNYATPALFPTENGGWYDPKDRQTMSVRKLNVKRAI
ncbi:unnamed protein product [Kluyveromyces dobzhanskii CBS 2104]|uniref:WGS project CCBQ000000000 data, contig 00106 n=1 Tax=Kluyveromyces dobzhanskii CBS 2104 TaxID=1427455 RepID=A0A0A8L7I5_9SACH|nr:unnamed protein product [Kluyveromyces dobzhanskii CBS 2104]